MKTKTEGLENNGLAGWSSNNDGPVKVDPVSDSFQSLTDPTNIGYVPTDREGMQVAVQKLTDNLPVDRLPSVYKAFRRAVELDTEKEEQEDMDRKAKGNDVKQSVEEHIKRIVVERLVEMGLIAEAMIDPADAIADEDPEEAEAEEIRQKRRHAYKSTAIGGMEDVGGATLPDIAKEFGISVSGAKRLADEALKKAQWLATDIDEEDREILVLQAINDYINYLAKHDDEMTPADVQLMKAHPQYVGELDGFREFLHNYIRRARKEDQKLLNPLADDDDLEDAEEVGLDDLAGELEHEREPVTIRPEAPVAAPKLPKDGYKIYGRMGGSKAHTRLKGQAYVAPHDTKFAPGEKAKIEPKDGKLAVKKMDSDHEQTWEPSDG